MAPGTLTPTRELAAFLRHRRENLSPYDVGLPPRSRARRTPGLRREELAELAAISIDYIIRLEQGRGLRPSADVLDALARVLRLSADERLFLFDLAQRRPRSTTAPEATAPPLLGTLVTDLSPLPAMLMNHRYDILAWNPEMAAVLVEFGALPPTQRNAIWLCLMHPEMRERYVDRARVRREGIAHLRAAWAQHPDDRVLAGLIEEFIAHDEEFARMWALRDVSVSGGTSKSLRHPEAGLLSLWFDLLTPLEHSGQRLLIARPADDGTRRALDQLLAVAT